MVRSSLLLSAVVAAGLVVGCQNNKKSADACKDCGDKTEMKADAKADAKSVAKADEKPIASCEAMETGPVPQAQAVAAGVHYGAAFKLSEAEAVPAAKVLADPAAYNGKTVRLTGKVTEVCAAKGCWLTFGDPKTQETIFIKFTDPASGKLVPLKAIGHEITAEGTIKVGQISEDFARHLVIDAGGTQEEAAKVVGPQKKIILQQPAVTIAGIEK